MDAEALLTAFARARVDFVVVGGIAAVLHGVLMTTDDLDLVPSRSPENIKRLAGVLGALEACHRNALPRRIEPTGEELAAPRHHQIHTSFGNLDVLGTLAGGLEYADLLPRAISVPLEHGLSIRVLDLAPLIELKQAAGRPKDQLHVLLLRAALEERRKREGK